MSFISDLLFQARKEERERVVTEFEEWAGKNVYKSFPSYSDDAKDVINFTDLLTFADSLKKKI